MFSCKNVDITHTYTHGRKTEFMFGLHKPYPKVKSVKRICEITDYYMNKYQRINLVLVGDRLSTIKKEKELGLSEIIIDGKVITPLDNEFNAIHSYVDRIKGSVITFNTNKLNKFCNWDFGIGRHDFTGLRKGNSSIKEVTGKVYLQYIFAHEFAHAIDAEYGLSDNSELREIYKNQEERFKNISEFIAECFVAREVYSDNEVANKVREIIDSIALKA